ncbi:hypothetical protein [Companilactobacillus sp. FL22-1]|uniref:hypothetical protein n=1 Tax=Companilactobacillus sp. FL22-1 TaxID=3373892 RepID=UPI0037547718
MKSVFKKMNGVIERVWNDRVTITGVKNGKQGPFSEDVPVVICENRPGKVILGSLKTSNQTEFGTDQYDAKLLIDNYEQKDYLLITTNSVLIFKGIAECIEIQNVLIDFFQNEFEPDFDFEEQHKKRCSLNEHLQ